MISPAEIKLLSLSELLRLWRSRDAEQWRFDFDLYVTTADQLLKLGEPLMAYDVLGEALKFWPAAPRLRQLQALALLRSGACDNAETILLELEQEGLDDEETLGLLGRIHKQRWEKGKTNSRTAAQELSLSHSYYRKAYELAGGYWSGINAAATALLSGNREAAATIARAVREHCSRELERGDLIESETYWLRATLAEAALILEDWSEADSLYRRAVEVGRGEVGNLVSSRHNALLILDHFGRDRDTIEEILRVPSVVVFKGQTIGGLDHFWPPVVPECEAAVRDAFRDHLTKLKPGIGYAAAGTVTDLLFLEALVEMDSEVHVVLPCNREQFLKDSLAIIPDDNWHARFESILEKAAEVVIASAQKITGDDVSCEYTNQILYGLAATQARQLGTDLYPLIAWDGSTVDVVDQIDRWGIFGAPVEMIDLSGCVKAEGRSTKINQTAGGKVVDVNAALVPEIRSMLFADALHFSRLNEDQIPLFLVHFLGTIAELLLRTPHQPLMKNTWGDGLFLVFEKVQDAGAFALELCDVINQTKWEEKSLPAELSLRIGLHAGPVYECVDPVSERQNFFGWHVSRAARIEPITPPGQVYASQAFAALAAALKLPELACDYVGQVPQAKGYGTFPTYHVHR
jgi:class 3 adenylate cyclase/tetratricopeptide (TPR) repeat protein